MFANSATHSAGAFGDTRIARITRIMMHKNLLINLNSILLERIHTNLPAGRQVDCLRQSSVSHFLIRLLMYLSLPVAGCQFSRTFTSLLVPWPLYLVPSWLSLSDGRPLIRNLKLLVCQTTTTCVAKEIVIEKWVMKNGKWITWLTKPVPHDRKLPKLSGKWVTTWRKWKSICGTKESFDVTLAKAFFQPAWIFCSMAGWKEITKEISFLIYSL